MIWSSHYSYGGDHPSRTLLVSAEADRVENSEVLFRSAASTGSTAMVTMTMRMRMTGYTDDGILMMMVMLVMGAVMVVMMMFSAATDAQLLYAAPGHFGLPHQRLSTVPTPPDIDRPAHHRRWTNDGPSFRSKSPPLYMRSGLYAAQSHLAMDTIRPAHRRRWTNDGPSPPR
jgi:hypothetical protein